MSDIAEDGSGWSGRYFEAIPAPFEGNPRRWVVRGKYRDGPPCFYVGIGGEWRAKLYAQALDSVEAQYHAHKDSDAS